MGVNSFFNPNYSEDEVWDLLTEYLEKKHHVNTSSIQRGIYADINRDGSILALEDQEYEHATLFCYRNFNFNISGSIIYQLDPPLNDEFDLEQICTYLNRPFPKPLIAPQLTIEQIQERKDNLRLLKLKKQKEDQISFLRSKVENIAKAALFCLEYRRAEKQNNIAYHYGQINKTADKSNYFVQNQIQHDFGAMVLASTPPKTQEYLAFLEEYREVVDMLEASFDEVVEYAKDKIANDIDGIISPSVRRSGCIILPVKNLEGVLLSAAIIPDIPETKNEFPFIKNEYYTGGAIQSFDPDQPEADIYFLTSSIPNADALKQAMPEACILVTLSPKNTVKTLQEIHAKAPNAIAVVVVNNAYAEIMLNKSIKKFEQSELCEISQYLADNLKHTGNVGVILSSFEDESENKDDEDIHFVSFHNILNDYGLEKLKACLNYQLSELAYRRENHNLELNFLLEKHAEAHERINDILKISLPALAQLDQDELEDNNPSLQTPLNITKASNPVLFQESQAEIKKWLNAPISNEILQQEKSRSEAAVNFAKTAQPLSNQEIADVLKSHKNEDVEDIF